MRRKLNVRILLILTAIGVMALAAACGSDNSGAASGENGEQQSSTEASSQTSTGNLSSEIAPQTTSGGLDPECAQLVLGRQVTGFTDLTEAERTRVFSECSEGVGDRSGAVAGFDPECMQEALGGPAGEAADFRNLTPEQRQTVFQACGGGIGATTGTFQLDGRPGGAGGALGSFLDTECMSDALGKPVDDIFELTQEERRQAASECLDGLSLPFDGRPEGFGPGQNSRPERPGQSGSSQAVPIN